MDVIRVGLPHVINGYIAAVTVDNQQPLLGGPGWLSQWNKHRLQPFQGRIIVNPAFRGYYKELISKWPHILRVLLLLNGLTLKDNQWR